MWRVGARDLKAGTAVAPSRFERRAAVELRRSSGDGCRGGGCCVSRLFGALSEERVAHEPVHSGAALDAQLDRVREPAAAAAAGRVAHRGVAVAVAAAAVGTCVEQPTERQGAIQSASTTHTRQHPHHARRDRYRLEARSTAVRKNGQSYLTRCGTGATRAETASTPHTTVAWVERSDQNSGRNKEQYGKLALPRGKQHTLDFFLRPSNGSEVS